MIIDKELKKSKIPSVRISNGSSIPRNRMPEKRREGHNINSDNTSAANVGRCQQLALYDISNGIPRDGPLMVRAQLATSHSNDSSPWSLGRTRKHGYRPCPLGLWTEMPFRWHCSILKQIQPIKTSWTRCGRGDVRPVKREPHG